jgi:hypothetical protein
VIAMLKCYQCAESGTVEESVSICIMCGKGLCMEHAKRIDLPIWEGGYPVPVKMLKKGLPRFVCSDCGNVLLPGSCE